jgi:hypothetical protein
MRPLDKVITVVAMVRAGYRGMDWPDLHRSAVSFSSAAGQGCVRGCFGH